MNTVPLAFEIFGEQHGGCPLLILHGFFASSRNWRTIARQLAAKRRVYVLDMRNHGLSPQAENMDYPAMAADVHSFMNRHGIETAHLLGHSMGGKIAMWFALNHPQRVVELVVADISPVGYQHNFDRTIDALKSLPICDLGNRSQALEWLEPAIADLSYRQFLLQNLLFQDGLYNWRINLDYFHANAPHIVGFPDTAGIEPYPRLATFLSGEDSAYIVRDAIYRLFPQASISEISGAGHWLHIDAPQQFCREVETCLNE